MAAVTAAVLAGALAGCGIRATSVPVDAGAAPTRESCGAPEGGQPTDAVGMMTVRVYLVCGRRLVPVERMVRDRQLNQLGLARLLMTELERKPDRAEERSGFASAVPEGLNVTGPAIGDPEGTLRLDQNPDELSSSAIVQLVCTFADAQSGSASRPVLLGGPDIRLQPHPYPCDNLRSVPLSGPTSDALSP